MKHVLLLLIVALNFAAWAQTPAYQIYSSTGKKVKYKKFIKSLQEQEALFFGEYHNNPIAHWLQLELVQSLQANDAQLTFGFEMFEADQQRLINDYLANQVKDRVFEDSCRIWTNYRTDYKPLILFAKNNGIPVIASNIPRWIATSVFRQGLAALDSLSAADLCYTVGKGFPVDTTLSQYQLMLEMAGNHNGMNFVYAQAIKDATMAHFLELLWKRNGQLVHFNGSFHSDFYQGIVWYLLQAYPDLSYKTITTVEQADVSKLDKEHLGRADFIICVNEDMTKTH